MAHFIPAESAIEPKWTAREHHPPNHTPAADSYRLPPEQEAFLLDRFTTTLEDPQTGRRIRPTSLRGTL